MTAIPEDSEVAWRPSGGGISWLWWLDRAFERARSTGKAEDDTRLRIFFVMVLFAAAFVTLGLAATKAALFSGLNASDRGAGLAPEARADLVDRNGQLLAVDIVRYGMYINPREIYDAAATKAALLSVLPTLSLAHLDTALTGPHKLYYVASGIAPEVKDRVHDLALAGVTFAEEPAREYPLGNTGAHVIGFADKGGRGLAGIEKAMDGEIRDDAGHDSVPLSIDLRVQGALQDELETAATHFGVKDAVGIVVNVHTGEILGMASWPDDVNPNDPGKSSPASMVNHAAATVYEPGSVFKVFTLAMGLDAGTTRVDEVYDVHTPLMLPGQIIHDYDKGDVNLPLWEVFTHSSNIGAGVRVRQYGPLLARLRPLQEGPERAHRVRPSAVAGQAQRQRRGHHGVRPLDLGHATDDRHRHELDPQRRHLPAPDFQEAGARRTARPGSARDQGIDLAHNAQPDEAQRHHRHRPQG